MRLGRGLFFVKNPVGNLKAGQGAAKIDSDKRNYRVGGFSERAECRPRKRRLAKFYIRAPHIEGLFHFSTLSALNVDISKVRIHSVDRRDVFRTIGCVSRTHSFDWRNRSRHIGMSAPYELRGWETSWGLT